VNEAQAGAEAAGSRLTYRNIIVLSDGTGNSSAKLFRTNIWKLYRALDLADPIDKKRPRQFAYYDDGVGSSSFTPSAVLGGVFGVGLARNVRDLYAFICRTYRPGDKIYLFGFSRGAFTVRVLAGLIATEGVALYTGSEGDLSKAAKAAHKSYRARRYADRNALFSLLARLFGSRPQAKQGQEANIAFIGVWDTVGAYGLPIDELTRAVDKFVYPMEFADRYLSDSVDRAMQALAIDEERNTFFPVLWNETQRNAPHELDPRLSQVWFAGVHADIGGGYSDDSFSFVPLDWIMTGAEAAGLRFLPEVKDDYAAQSDANGPLHDSRKGVGGFYRYMPRRIGLVLKALDDCPHPPIRVHRTVLERIKDGGDGYAPIVLPSTFDVAELDGAINAGYAPNPAPPVNSGYSELREHVFDYVWLRRVVYFPTLFVALALLAGPFWPRAEPAEDWRRHIASFYEALAAHLPRFARWWLDAFQCWPGTSAALITLTICGLVTGARIARAITDRMRAIWYSDYATRPDTAGPFALPKAASGAASALQKIRLSIAYRTFWKGFRRHFAPTFLMLVVVALPVLAALWAL
jgi:uncharacterized protein (DUF2235 family)